MPDPEFTPPIPGLPADLPMQPSGSGVADLEVAFERMKLAEDDEEVAGQGSPLPTVSDRAAQESEAHPS